jgi:hypothetical protein
MTPIISRCLEDLILARLSVKTKSPLARSDVTKSLYPFVQLNLTLPEWRAQFDQALERLRSDGLVEDDALAPTDKGMARLQAALGVVARPTAKDWRAFKVRYLPRLVLAGARVDKVTAVNPALEVLGDHLAAPSEARKTDSRVVNAWLARTLELRNDKVTFGSLRAALLARELGVPARPALEQVVRLAVAKLAGSRSAKPDDVLQALTARWLQGGTQQRAENGRPISNVAAETATPAGLVEKVHAAAHGPAARRFGPNKVFIASVWEALCRDPEVSALGEGGFKRALAEAHREGSLVLARADLVAAMDPRDVMASEVQHLNATYHFIQLEGEAQ